MLNRLLPHINLPEKVRKNIPIGLLIAALSAVALLTGCFFYKYNRLAVGYCSKSVIFIGAICAALVLIFGLILLLLKHKEKGIASDILFIAMAFVCGISFSMAFPAVAVPDEGSHFYWTYQYANMLQGIPGDDDALSMRVTDNDFTKDMQQYLSPDLYKKTFDGFFPAEPEDSSRALYPKEGGSVVTLNMVYSPQMRLPGALGILLAEALNLNGTWMFYLGRLFNFLWFLALAFLAIRITPVGKTLFMAIVLLPMTMHLVSSYSTDATTIGLSLLFISIILNFRFCKKTISKPATAGMLLTIFLLAPCKVVYGLLSLLILFIPSKKFGSKHYGMLIKAFTFGAAIIGLLVFSIPNLISISGVNRSEGAISSRVNETGVLRSLSDVTKPVEVLFVYINTIYEQTTFYLTSFLGGSLGWFQGDITPPFAFVLPYLFILIAAAQKSKRDKININKNAKAIFGLVSILIILGVMTSMYLGWTFSTDFCIQGVQGRYFLPIAPLLFLVIRSSQYVLPGNSSSYVTFGTFGLNMIYVIYIFAAVQRIA